MRHLLLHTSGLRDYPLAALQAPPHPHRVRDLLSAVELRLHSPAGEIFSYSTLGYLLLEAIVERVTGQPFDDALRTRVLKPLGIGTLGPSPSDYFLSHAAGRSR